MKNILLTLLIVPALLALSASHSIANESDSDGESRVYIYNPDSFVDNCGCPEQYNVHCTSPDDLEKELKATSSTKALDEFDHLCDTDVFVKRGACFCARWVHSVRSVEYAKFPFENPTCMVKNAFLGWREKNASAGMGLNMMIDGENVSCD